jgi:DNA-binding FadR family transcriptional regulator
VSSNLTTATALLVSLGEFEVPEVLEARHELEVTCARLAAKRNTVPELDVMAKEIETQKNSALSDVEFCASDVRFHRAMANASHNPVLKFVMFAVIEALQPIENMAVFRFREREEIVKQHEKMLAALKARDTEAAVAAVTEQTEYLRERFDAAQAWRRQRIAE